ncbi:MAG TPA: hypothetical protein VM942_06410 [Acidimicrobiales bacterium]|nr:hypothetical protein [Acidimicrobiales bacterium]
MKTIRTRIIGLAAASAVVMSLGALGAGPVAAQTGIDIGSSKRATQTGSDIASSKRATVGVAPKHDIRVRVGVSARNAGHDFWWFTLDGDRDSGRAPTPNRFAG